jgi:hypothetical protein
MAGPALASRGPRIVAEQSSLVSCVVPELKKIRDPVKLVTGIHDLRGLLSIASLAPSEVVMTPISACPCLPTPERRSVWHRFFGSMVDIRAQKMEDEVANFFDRHRYDLPPELLIELERRR